MSPFRFHRVLRPFILLDFHGQILRKVIPRLHWFVPKFFNQEQCFFSRFQQQLRLVFRRMKKVQFATFATGMPQAISNFCQPVIFWLKTFRSVFRIALVLAV